jgi:phosphoserine phosphatase RsbU/P
MNSRSKNSLSQFVKLIVDLGNNLLEKKSISEQREYIVALAETLFSGKINLWLPDPDDQNSANFTFQFDQDSSFPYSGLLQEAMLLKRIATDASGSCAAAPILHRDVPLGMMQINKANGEKFSSEELDLLKSFTEQTALSLHALKRELRDRRQLELLSLIQSVSAQISNILDLDELSHRVTRLILDTFQYYYVAIFTLDKYSQRLSYRASAQPHLEYRDDIGSPPLLPVSVQIGQGIIGHVAQTGERVVVNNVESDPLYRKIDILPDTKSEAALPLMVETRVLGVLDVQSNRINDFTETDILVLQALADNIAKAVESARLYGDIQRRANQLTVVAEVSNAITSILDYDDLIKEVVKLVHQNLGYPMVRLYSVHPGRRKIFLLAGYSKDGEQVMDEGDEVSFSFDDNHLEIAKVAQTGSTSLVYHDMDDEPEIIQYADQIDIMAVLIIPLIFTEEILGVLELQSNQVEAFDLDEKSLMEALADNIATAFRNANLYRSEIWRRQVADSMRELAGLLTAKTAVDQVLKLMLLELEKALPCDISAIWLTEKNSAEDIPSRLYLANVHLTQAYLQKFGSREGGLTADDIAHILTQSELPSLWLLDALSSPDPLIRQPDHPYEPLGAILDFPMDYSAIAAPLRLKGEPFGLLVLAHHTSSRYGHEAQSMTETFASYAAISIENTRLYESAHDQAWISTVLLQVSEATQSVNNLDELLKTLVRITPMLIGVNSCSIYLWDSSTDTFTPTATFGLDSEKADRFLTQRIHLGEIPCFDQLLLSKNPIFVDSQSSNDNFISFDLESEVLVLFPMVSHNEVLGAFLIVYDLIEESTKPENEKLNIGWEDKFSIIQGITHQAAIAVENIKLIKAQQDEAYVSIALLQVAQAIVSVNALDEILEAIVRITPILVGVKRSMIFIWDPSRNVFRLMKYYGLNRADLPMLDIEFHPADFPLLDSVHNSNSIVFHEMDDESESPLDWMHLEKDEFDFIENDILPDLYRNPRQSKDEDYIGKDYLKASSGLLYGFPLAVKGVVLGVMLTQERERPGELPSRHIREKRLEISIGISQQAAMAIQNDLLQREVLERERLEREFQLAREIQQTFLPDSLPEHERWELYSLWRPARQVSGDFYDVIPLRGDKWGLVIADVADKGMPAALYMTLIRTLLRASVKDEDNSPAFVLQRVNDLLVADSKSGMFVTLFYGVLSTNSHSFTYANAGHNPPIIIRSNNPRLQKLPGTGMALGIFEGIKIQQRTVRFKPGDSLVLYTDGITEAFSPHNQMFGEKRLMQTIRRNGILPARELAQSIDLAVTSFIQDGTSSDDITMLILRRIS